MKMKSRMMKAVVSTNSSSFCCSPGSICEAERILVADHDAEHEYRHEAARLQIVGGEIGADHRDQRHHRGVFGEEVPALMRDQERGQIAEHRAGDDADGGLLEQIEQRRRQREFAGAHGHPQHAESDDGADGVVERRTRSSQSAPPGRES